MKYEFKPYSPAVFADDLKHGWKPTYRVAEDYPTDSPRDLVITDLGPLANYKARLVSIDLANGGAVRTHSVDGLFSLDQKPCCLDVILYREATPKPREISGMAYVDADNKVVSLRCAEDSEERIAGSLHPVPCTITLHFQ